MKIGLHRLLPLFVFLFNCNCVFSQEIVVNEYFDESSQNNEWTELVVVKDDLDLRGWYIGDNNSSTNNWQPKLRFRSSNSFWQHMRAGTIILLDHAQDSEGCADNSFDIDKSDGFVRVCVRDSPLFEGGSSTTQFIGSSGDYIQIVDPSGKMVHGIGHDENPGGSVIGTPCFTTSANWTDINAAKANTPPCPTGPFTFWKINLNPPMSLRMTAGSLPEFSSHLLEANSVNSVIDTSDTPFTGIGNGPANDAWLKGLRAPVFEAQTICPTKDSSGNISFTWNTMLDSVPTDGTSGYMVVRNQTNNFGLPEQGTEYAVNSLYGTGTQEVKVVALLDHPSAPTITYTENPGPGTFYYRVFAYRYKNTPNFFHPTRGRSYNLQQYVRICDSLLSSSISSIYGKNNITISPNPVKKSSELTISGLTESCYQISISSIQGRVIWQGEYTQEMDSNNLKIPLPDVSEGLYFLNIQGKNEFSTKRIQFF